jgi:alanine transaminase
MNKQVISAEYAVRGRLVILAEKLAAELKQPNHGLPFDEIIFTNIGNPQSVGTLFAMLPPPHSADHILLKQD